MKLFNLQLAGLLLLFLVRRWGMAFCFPVQIMARVCIPESKQGSKPKNSEFRFCPPILLMVGASWWLVPSTTNIFDWTPIRHFVDITHLH